MVGLSHWLKPTRGDAGTRHRWTVGMVWEVVPLLVVLSLCLALRTIRLDALPVFDDEALYTRAALLVTALPPHTGWFISLNYGAPPLFFWLSAPLVRALSDPLLAARLVSAVVGTAAVLPLWAVARTLWGQATALLAGLLYALCPFTLFYNRLALLDGLVATCTAGALLFAIRLARHARRRDALALGLCLAAGLFTKIFAASALVLPVLAVAVAQPPDRRAVFRLACLSMVLAVVPLAVLLLLPQSSDLVANVHVHAHHQGTPFGTLVDQIGTWGAALWLYLTPPVIVLAAAGLWTIRHERVARLLWPWALLGGLPPAIVPLTFLAPRYFLYVAVPILLLAARGVVVLVMVACRRWPYRLPLQVAALLGAGILVTPAVAADTTIIATPARTPLLPFDRWQYVTGWPSGYALMRVVAYLRDQETQRQLALIVSQYDTPRDALFVLLTHDPHIIVGAANYSLLSRHPLRAIPGRRTFVLACHPYGQPLPRHAPYLRLVFHAATADGHGSDDLYEITK